MSKTYKIECDRCKKITEYAQDEEELLNYEFIEILKLGYTSMHLCRKCNQKVTADPKVDEQLMEDILGDITDSLRKH